MMHSLVLVAAAAMLIPTTQALADNDVRHTKDGIQLSFHPGTSADTELKTQAHWYSKKSNRTHRRRLTIPQSISDRDVPEIIPLAMFNSLPVEARLVGEHLVKRYESPDHLLRLECSQEYKGTIGDGHTTDCKLDISQAPAPVPAPADAGCKAPVSPAVGQPQE